MSNQVRKLSEIKTNRGGAGINILLLITFLPIIITCVAGALSFLLGCQSGMEGTVSNCYFESADSIISNMIPVIWLSIFTVPAGIGILILISIVSLFKK